MSERFARLGGARRRIVVLALCVALAWAVSLGWWMVLEPAQARAGPFELVIPEGTAAAIERGEDPPFIPNSLSLARDGSLEVVNDDSVAHQVGEWTIEPGQRATIEASGDKGTFVCTIAPDGVLGFASDEPPPFWSTAYGALLGFPLGLAFVAAGIATGQLR